MHICVNVTGSYLCFWWRSPSPASRSKLQSLIWTMVTRILMLIGRSGHCKRLMSCTGMVVLSTSTCILRRVNNVTQVTVSHTGSGPGRKGVFRSATGDESQCSTPLSLSNRCSGRREPLANHLHVQRLRTWTSQTLRDILHLPVKPQDINMVQPLWDEVLKPAKEMKHSAHRKQGSLNCYLPFPDIWKQVFVVLYHSYKST